MKDSERRVGARRVIRVGDHVKIVGVRGVWRITGFRGDEVDVFGRATPLRAPMLRAFRLDRVARRVIVQER